MITKVGWSLLMVAALSDPLPGDSTSGAVPVFRCDFEEPADVNFDHWPDDWTRGQGQGFPQFVQLAIQRSQQPCPSGHSCLVIRLDGGAAVAYSPAIPIDTRCRYQLNGYLRTHQLHHQAAFYSLTYYSANDRPLYSIASRAHRDARQWTRETIDAMTPPPSSRYARIGVHVEPPPGEESTAADLHAVACFDDVRLLQVARLVARSSEPSAYDGSPKPSGLLTMDHAPEFDCDLSVPQVTDLVLLCQLLDVNGDVVDQAEFSLADTGGVQRVRTGHDPGQGSSIGMAPGTESLVGTVRWKPRRVGCGHYRAEFTLRHGTSTMGRDTVTIALIDQPTEHDAISTPRDFGWSLPQLPPTLDVKRFAQLVKRCEVGWLKLPVPTGNANDDQLAQLHWLLEYLADHGIQTVGVLDRPSGAAPRGEAETTLISAAQLFQSSQLDRWETDLAFKRLAFKIGWWQLGDDLDFDNADQATLSQRTGWCWQRWRHVYPSSRQQEALPIRARDLITRMVQAKAEGSVTFVVDPFHADRSLVQPDGTPGELLLPWRTTARLLDGSEYVGTLPLTGGSTNYVFARGNQLVMVIWADASTEEVVRLGHEARVIDPWGKSSPQSLVLRGTDQPLAIRVTSQPLFLTNIDPAAIQDLPPAGND